MKNILFILTMMGVVMLQAEEKKSQVVKGKKTKVVMLGTGTPVPDPDRSGPGVAVVVNNQAYIVDAGSGIVRRAEKAYKQKKIPALKSFRLNKVFLTHLHSDHTLGLPDLIFTPWIVGRKKPLELYGPPGTKEMADDILRAYNRDIKVRLGGYEKLGKSRPEGYKVNAVEIEPGVIYKDKNVTVKAIKVNHGAWDRAYGFRFETPDRVIVVSGDRTANPDIAEQCKGCDILVHEVYSAERLKKMGKYMKNYHTNSHTSTKELAALANKVQPKLVVLYHQLPFGAKPEELLNEIKDAGYKGKVVYANDLDVY